MPSAFTSRDDISVRKEKGCEALMISKDVKNENTYFLFEQWESDEVLKAHQETEHFKTCFSEGFKQYWTFVSMQKGEPIC